MNRISLEIMSIKNTSGGGKFSGGPSVRIWHFHSWGLGFNPLSGN